MVRVKAGSKSTWIGFTHRSNDPNSYIYFGERFFQLYRFVKNGDCKTFLFTRVGAEDSYPRCCCCCYQSPFGTRIKHNVYIIHGILIVFRFRKHWVSLVNKRIPPVYHPCLYPKPNPESTIIHPDPSCSVGASTRNLYLSTFAEAAPPINSHRSKPIPATYCWYRSSVKNWQRRFLSSVLAYSVVVIRLKIFERNKKFTLDCFGK